MKARREARRIAVDVLYEAEIRGLLPLDALEAYATSGYITAGTDDDEERSHTDQMSSEARVYARGLVEGIQSHSAELDALIAGYADHWALDRMPVVDKALLRIALFEILWGEDVPVAVAINEAVELAKTLSTEDSGRFINGLLGRIAERERSPDGDHQTAKAKLPDQT